MNSQTRYVMLCTDLTKWKNNLPAYWSFDKCDWVGLEEATTYSHDAKERYSDEVMMNRLGSTCQWQALP